RPRRIHDLRRVEVERRRLRGHRPSGDDARLEAIAIASLHLDRVGIDELAEAVHQVDLAQLRQTDEVLRQRIDDLLPVSADAVDAYLRGGELEADVFGVLGVGDEFRSVEDGLGGDAADVQTGAAGAFAVLDEGDLEAVVGGEESGGVTSGPAAE